MAHQYFNENVNNHGTSFVTMPNNNNNNGQYEQNNYEYEWRKSMERERQMIAAQAQQQLQRDHALARAAQTPFGSNNAQKSLPISPPQANRAVLPTAQMNLRPGLSSPKPLRIIIIRHAERADAVLGSDWSKKGFDRSGRYIRFSEHLPDALPTRSYLHHYVIDVPLTNRGRMHAFKTGKALLFNGYAADICYSSPSLRCVQSADGILAGMGRRGVPMQLEPGLFECYLNDFKRTLCFMTKDELAANGYNIEKSYQALMPFMRPHDSQLDYYERCRIIMDTITERHQATGGTILIVAHAPSLEGLTRHLSGGKLQPERLFDIARRVPFLAMTIIEKNGLDAPWLFRTQPLQTGQTQSIREVGLELVPPPTPISMAGPTLPMNVPLQQQQQQQHQQQLRQQQQQQQQQQMGKPPQPQPITMQQNLTYLPHEQQGLPPNPNQNGRPRLPPGPIQVDPKKVVKSSTAPNLRMSNSLSKMFRVI